MQRVIPSVIFQNIQLLKKRGKGTHKFTKLSRKPGLCLKIGVVATKNFSLK